MRHYLANFDQHGTNIVVGIFDADDLLAAERVIRNLACSGALFVNAFEVDPTEVSRVRSEAGRQVPAQFALFS